MSVEEWQELGVIVPKLAKLFRDVLGTDDYMILEKNGRKAFQSVFHVHFHLLPVHKKMDWISMFIKTPKVLTEQELQEKATAFKAYFAAQ